ncbi:putative oxidoreductase [Lachnellula suecica]|uniref:Putative oxidoreductase n=1 Tax=Lachnellula suecica TaxID=602035 RepID=A0A8T9CD16_9HELO|nr:putative oxidoreductase [Lachnellula suecica]
MGVTWSQFFPPSPTLTKRNLPRQDGKVFIVTGGASGIGYELCTILYQAGGKVYLAGRSEANAQAAISAIKAIPTSTPASGSLTFLPISLDDFSTIKPFVTAFTAAESRLDVLFNNAGVSNPPPGSLGAQGQELQLATNCLGPYLLTQLLLPLLESTAKTSTPNTVRVIWTSSIATTLSPSITPSDWLLPSPNQQKNYTTSKTGNWFLASSLHQQGLPILSLVQNPGNLKTALTRHLSRLVPILAAPLLYGPRMGAYTALWAGLDGSLGLEDGGKCVLPWGRLHPSPPKGLLDAMKTEAEGGTGVAAI